jgi:integrase/recombinase XerD
MSYVFVREPLSKESADRLVNACKTFREKLGVWTLLDTGLRVGELCSLQRQNVHWQENRIVVWGKSGPYGKRKKRRIVPLTERVKQLLEIHFVSHECIGMTVRSAQRMVKRVANRAMITQPVTPHVLRHTFAVNCVKKGLSTASLKKILGHDRLETTEIYLNISPEDALGEFFSKVADARR